MLADVGETFGKEHVDTLPARISPRKKETEEVTIKTFLAARAAHNMGYIEINNPKFNIDTIVSIFLRGGIETLTFKTDDKENVSNFNELLKHLDHHGVTVKSVKTLVILEPFFEPTEEDYTSLKKVFPNLEQVEFKSDDSSTFIKALS